MHTILSRIIEEIVCSLMMIAGTVVEDKILLERYYRHTIESDQFELVPLPQALFVEGEPTITSFRTLWG
jgi:hypothetical protein